MLSHGTGAAGRGLPLLRASVNWLGATALGITFFNLIVGTTKCFVMWLSPRQVASESSFLLKQHQEMSLTAMAYLIATVLPASQGTANSFIQVARIFLFLASDKNSWPWRVLPGKGHGTTHFWKKASFLEEFTKTFPFKTYFPI